MAFRSNTRAYQFFKVLKNLKQPVYIENLKQHTYIEYFIVPIAEPLMES